MPLSERLRQIEAAHQGDPTPDITEPSRSPEHDAPSDTPHGMDQAAALIRDRLPIAGERTYRHTPEGYVDAETGELYPAIPTGT